MTFEYLEKIKTLLSIVEEQEQDSILRAVEVIADKIEDKRQLFVFGASHAGIITEELFYRAGGLALFNPILEAPIMLAERPITKTSKMEQLEGYGQIIFDGTPFKEGDLLIIHSVSGRNPVAIDMAIRAREKGIFVIALTNLTYSKSVSSRHSSGKCLFELADLVLDNHGDIGDASIAIEGLEQKVTPTSTVIGAAIMNTIVSETVRELVKRDIIPPVLFSANLDGGAAHNEKIFSAYKEVIHYE